MQKEFSSQPAVKEAFSLLDDTQKSSYQIIANLYSIVVTLDALENAYVQGRLDDESYSLKKKSLSEQFKSCMKGASVVVSEEQFFKDYFPNNQYTLGVNVVRDNDGTIQRLRDEVMNAFTILNSTINHIRIKREITNSMADLKEKLKNCLEYAHKQFDYNTILNEMEDLLSDDVGDDDSNIQSQNLLTNLTNLKDELEQNFMEIRF